LIGINIQENENIDRALKRFKKKYERSGILKEFKKCHGVKNISFLDFSCLT